MAAGYTTLGICFDTPQRAIDAHFQDIKPYALLSTGNTIFVEPIKLSTGVWQWKKWTQSNSGAVTTQYTVNAVNPQYGSCTLPDSIYNYADAAAMWGFAFSSVFAFWFLAKNIGSVINAIKRF